MGSLPIAILFPQKQWTRRMIVAQRIAIVLSESQKIKIRIRMRSDLVGYSTAL